MIRSLAPATNRFLTDLAEITRRVERAQREITSGRRINRVSDDPERISRLVQARTEIGQTEQIRFNLNRVKTEVDAAEQALQAAMKVLDRAAVLGTQGANETQTAEQRGIICREVTMLLEQMVDVTRAVVAGRYIFSGDADGEVPFTLDLTQDFPVSAYMGSDATRQVMHPCGTLFSIARTAEDIFHNADPANNVLDAINNLRLALRDDDTDAIVSALEQVRSAAVHLNNELAYYGATQNQVAEAIDFAHKQELRLRTELSVIEDADLTESILALNQARYQQEVALASQAKLPKISLFDFLG
jgi:flagellar hook-associated protein 3 FlgL